MNIRFFTAALTMLSACGPAIDPTPVGRVNDVADFRPRLPDWATDRPVAFSYEMSDNAKSETFDLKDAGTIRLTVWSAADGNMLTMMDHPQIVSGFAVDLRDNPNGAHVTWRILDDSHLDQALVFEVRSEWNSGVSRREWIYVGQVGEATNWRFKEQDSLLPP